MRKILFRGKRKDNGNWVYGFPFAEFVGFDIDGIETWDGERHLVINDTVGQYIGMKDTNGNKIFEGDIVICKYFIHEHERTYITVYEDNGYYFKLINEDTSYHPSDTDNIRIIGNIHDNPELIGG